MNGFPSPFSGPSDGESEMFDEYDQFAPDYIPTPGWFLEGHAILVDEDHIAFHEITKDIFEDRGVYDMTFGYNLARLNLDTRHPDAGYRYALDSDNPSVLRAEFTPTTPFCPQSDTLTKGSFRAWNGLSDRHEYEIVRVRVAEMHHRSDEINDALEDIEKKYFETGSVAHVGELESRDPGASGKHDCSDGTETTRGEYEPDGPF